jgi:hypothetical protein
MFRVLKSGGRVALSDIALKRPLPSELDQSLLAYIGCIAGAILIEHYVQQLQAAGFDSVKVVDTRKDLNAYEKVEFPVSTCCSTELPVASVPDTQDCSVPAAGSDPRRKIAELLARYNVNDYAASVQVYALKSR